ncbi:uncharacterized protein METZ01_LOCUS231939, partial [marine metagenome]
VNLQTAFIRNAKMVGPAVVNISKIREATDNHAMRTTPYGEDSSWLLSLKYCLITNFVKKNIFPKQLDLA